MAFRREARYGVEYTEKWRDRTKWFRSEIARARWIRRHEDHVWIAGRVERELPTVIPGSSRLREYGRVFGRSTSLALLLTRGNS